MSITLSLYNALSGLRAASAALSVVSSNVSNANTPGYTRKTLQQTANTYNGIGAGVSLSTVYRVVDEGLRKDVRQQASVLGASTVTSSYMAQMQDTLGSTAQGGVLSNAISNLSTALSGLATTPSDAAQQGNVVAAASSLATSINRVETSVQQLRTQADQDLATAVTTVNTDLNKIVDLNRQIARASALNQPTGDLSDQRDAAVSDLATQMGIQTFVRDDGEMVVYTSSGRTLVDGVANLLSYAPQQTVTAQSSFNSITLGAEKINITNEISSGKIGALRDMRDNQLPEVTKELNTLTRALYDLAWAPPPTPTTSVSAAGNLSSSAPAGTVVDVPYSGNTQINDSASVGYNATLRFTKTGTSSLWTVSVVSLSRASDQSIPTSTPPLPQTIGTFDPSNPSTIPALNLTLQQGSAAPTTLNVNFTYSSSSFTQTTAGSQVIADNQTYRLFQNVNLVDPTKDNALGIQVNKTFDPNQGGQPGLLYVANDNVPTVAQRLSNAFQSQIDTRQVPYSSVGAQLSPGPYTLGGFANAILSNNSVLAANAAATETYQDQYSTSLTQRATAVDGVNVDEELSNMILYQNAYAASARVLTAASSMFDTLLAIKQ